jgi:hypothetical protein
MVAVNDIGAVAAEVFLSPAPYQGCALSLAGDELSYEQFAKYFTSRWGNRYRLHSESLVLG